MGGRLEKLSSSIRMSSKRRQQHREVGTKLCVAVAPISSIFNIMGKSKVFLETTKVGIGLEGLEGHMWCPGPPYSENRCFQRSPINLGTPSPTPPASSVFYYLELLLYNAAPAGGTI